jgi:hypothetical protein
MAHSPVARDLLPLRYRTVQQSAIYIHKKREALFRLKEYINKEVTPTELSLHRKELREHKKQREVQTIQPITPTEVSQEK